MLRVFNIENGRVREQMLDDADLQRAVTEADWIDSFDPSESEHQQLENFLRTELPESEEVDELEDSSRYFMDTAGIHVHSLYLSRSEGGYGTETVAFILQKDRLITLREGEVPDFRLVRMRARRGQVEANSVTELLIRLVDQKVENLADVLEDTLHKLDDVSHFVLDKDTGDLEDAIEKLANLEDANGKIRLCLMDTQRAISFLQRHIRTDQQLVELGFEIKRDIETLLSHSSFLSDKVNFLMESTQGFINIQQNQIIKTFSIAAVVFLPPTLIASIYGMNFVHMPELEWVLGYPGALVLMLLSGLAPYWLFKRKGWL